MMVKNKIVDEINGESVPDLDLSSQVTLKKMYIPEKSKETVFIDGTPDEIAEKLVDVFKNEIQVLDSYNNRTYSNGQAGSVYKQHIPLVNASRKPGEWQTYDIIFKAPVFSESGNLESPAYVTVFHNGVLIQNNVQIQGYVKFIGYPEYKAHPSKLPIKLQDHSNLVSFRNIWVREL